MLQHHISCKSHLIGHEIAGRNRNTHLTTLSQPLPQMSIFLKRLIMCDVEHISGRVTDQAIIIQIINLELKRAGRSQQDILKIDCL